MEKKILVAFFFYLLSTLKYTRQKYIRLGNIFALSTIYSEYMQSRTVSELTISTNHTQGTI